MSLTARAIAKLAAPFEGGGGPSHATVEMIFTAADAREYLGEGNKLDRVMGGLQALRKGRRAGPEGPALPPDPEKLQEVAEDLAIRLEGLLDPEFAREILGEGDVSEGVAPAAPVDKAGVRPAFVTTTESASDRRAVMVVHGQDAAATKALFAWLRSVDLKPGEWSQLVRASGSASPFIGDVLERAFTDAQAVVVLFTPDETVALRPELASRPQRPRLQARPNVLFEAGMALARHPTRTILVVLGEQDLPSDLAGRHYVRLGSVGALRDLAQRLEAAGCAIDITGDEWLDVTRFPNRDDVDT